MSSLYCVHAVSVGRTAMRASRGTIDAALREAKFLLRSGCDFVWVDDGNGNVIVPAAEVRALLDARDGRRRETKAALCAYRASSAFGHYLDMAAGSSDDADQTSDARFRFFLIDLAATRCDLAREFLDGAATEPEPLEETAETAAEQDSSEPQATASLEGLEPRMIATLKPRIVH
jgi:hypothetical protein